MSIVIDGTGTISGVSATGLSSAQTITSVPTSALPTGTIKQVVTAVMANSFSTSSGSWVDTGFSATITPTSSTSKILILFNSGGTSRPAVASECPRLQIVRGSSTFVYGASNLFYTTNSLDQSDWSSSFQYVDSPATTSSTTYKIQMQTRLNNSCSMNVGASAGQNATLTLLEIAA
jgi:hypothetical protein